MFWDPPADHQPTDVELDLAERWQVSERTRLIAMAMIEAAERHDTATGARSVGEPRHGTAVYVGLALPGKTYGCWVLGQAVEEAPGFFLADADGTGNVARDLADRAAGQHLAGRPGTSSYARLTAGERCAVWEGMYGTD